MLCPVNLPCNLSWRKPCKSLGLGLLSQRAAKRNLAFLGQNIFKIQDTKKKKSKPLWKTIKTPNNSIKELLGYSRSSSSYRVANCQMIHVLVWFQAVMFWWNETKMSTSTKSIKSSDTSTNIAKQSTQPLQPFIYDQWYSQWPSQWIKIDL